MKKDRTAQDVYEDIDNIMEESIKQIRKASKNQLKQAKILANRSRVLRKLSDELRVIRDRDWVSDDEISTLMLENEITRTLNQSNFDNLESFNHLNIGGLITIRKDSYKSEVRARRWALFSIAFGLILHFSNMNFDCDCNVVQSAQVQHTAMQFSTAANKE